MLFKINLLKKDTLSKMYMNTCLPTKKTLEYVWDVTDSTAFVRDF